MAHRATIADWLVVTVGNGARPRHRPDDLLRDLPGTTRQTTAPVPAKFVGQTVRFQAGDYQQADTSAGPEDGGRVVFHRLAEQHTNP